MVKVKVKKLKQNALLPKYMTAGAAGCDAFSCLETEMIIKPMERAAIPTGLSVEIPMGYEIQVRPRSGLSFKQGLTVVNAPGTIDSDYRGEIQVLVVNLGSEPITVKPGDRIAQFILQEVTQIEWVETQALEQSLRGASGFGSTGVVYEPNSH